MKSLIWLQGTSLCILVAVFVLFLFQKPTINIDAPIQIPVTPAQPSDDTLNTLTHSIIKVSDSMSKNITVLVDFTCPTKLTVLTAGSSLIIKEVRDDDIEPKTLKIPVGDDINIYSSRLFPHEGRTRLSLEISAKGE